MAAYLNVLVSSNWDVFLLVFLRVSGLIFSSPIFGRQNIPASARIGYCAVLACFFYISIVEVQNQTVDYNDDMFIYVLLCAKELLFGLILGYVLNLFLTLTFTAGQIIDMQMGFGMVNVFDVQSNLSVPVTGNFLNIIILLAFLAQGGHLKLIQMMHTSFYQVPVGAVAFNPQALGYTAMQLFIQAFLLAVIVAMPIIGSGLLTEVCFGILMRMVPQMNAFSIGMPVKVILGFIVIVAFLPTYVYFTQNIFNAMFTGLDRMFADLVAGPA